MPDLSLEAFIAWLETRDPEEIYSYTDPRDCLLARFLKDRGVEKYSLCSYEAAEFFNDRNYIIQGDYSEGGKLSRARWTAGDALLRAREFFAIGEAVFS